MLGISVLNPQLHSQRYLESRKFCVGSDASTCEITIDDPLIQACHFEVDWKGDTHPSSELTIRNLGNTLLLMDGRRLRRGTSCEVALPMTLWVGNSVIRLFSSAERSTIDDYLTFLPCTSDEVGFTGLAESFQAPASSTLVEWFHAFSQLHCLSPLGDEQQRAEYYQRATQAIFDPGGFDGGLVIKKQQGDWRIAASYLPHPQGEISYRRDLLERVLTQKATLFHDANQLAHLAGDTQGAGRSEALSPILDEQQEVTGFVYGMRYQHNKNSRVGIRPLEAHFLSLVAQAISHGEIRAKRDEEITASQLLLRQVFPEEVATQMRDDPQVLSGKSKEVTVLFADLRGYTNLVDQTDPSITFRMISDVMERWTHLVTQYEGAIVDYFGDGLTAFWNAPLDTAGHPSLAVQCAFEIHRSLQAINQDWGGLINQPIDAGIGIATGEALVGNCGSRTRIKYGPHGATVNLASRLEKATKMLRVPILISEVTAQHVAKTFSTRRLVRARLKGFQQPVTLYQPLPNEELELPQGWFDQFEFAIQQMESSEYEQAEEILGNLLQQQPSDTGTQALISLAQQRVELPLVLENSPGNHAE